MKSVSVDLPAGDDRFRTGGRGRDPINMASTATRADMVLQSGRSLPMTQSSGTPSGDKCARAYKGADSTPKDVDQFLEYIVASSKKK